MKLQFFHDFIVSQKRLKLKENQTIYRNMTRKPQSHVRFLTVLDGVLYYDSNF